MFIYGWALTSVILFSVTVQNYSTAVTTPTNNGLSSIPGSSYTLHGINFSPYIDDQDPNTGILIDEGQLSARLELINGHTNWVRTFGVTNGLEKTGDLAHGLGQQAAIGAWLDRDLTTNDLEIENLIVAANSGAADMVIIGSEVLLRGDLTETQLITYIARVKKQIPVNIPVAYADVYQQLLDHPAVLKEVDVILANYYPYWEGIAIDQAMSAVHQWHKLVSTAANGKPVIVSETGWPSEGEKIGSAIASSENASFYFLNFISWARALNVNYFYFSAFDEKWKAAYEGTQGAHWGVWDRFGNLKPGMELVFNGDTVPDNWSGTNIPGGPGDPLIEFSYVPPLNSFKNLQGRILHVAPNSHKVAVYIYVGGYWSKPTFSSPSTTIRPDGTWTTDITTGGIDQTASRVAAFLVPIEYSPPKMSGGGSLPTELETNAVASIEIIRDSTFPTPELVSLNIPPPSTEIETGKTLQLTATGRFTNKSTKDVTSSVLWTSANTNVLTIDSNGLATGISADKVLVTVTDSETGITASRTLEIISVELQSLEISPNNPIIRTNSIRHLVSVGIFSHGRVKNITENSTWSSSNESVVIISNEKGSKGLLTGLSMGTAVISAVDLETGIRSETIIIVDDSKAPISYEDFLGEPTFSADNGQWQIGTPTVGPSKCFIGFTCVGTVLDGNYDSRTDSRLISPTTRLPEAGANEEIHLRFKQWFSLSNLDIGYIQVSVLDETNSQWSEWTTVSNSIENTSTTWSPMSVDLTAYAGKKVRVGFYHTANRLNCCGSESSGWYIDDIQIVVIVPEFGGSFEQGIGDWGSDRGQWQTGTGSSISGPEVCATGNQCVGTNFNSNYGGRTDSRLISPTTRLPEAGADEEILLRFSQWFSLSDLDIGYIQISVLDETSGQWSGWVSVGNSIENTSAAWSPMSVDLTAYSDKKVRVGFYHTANRLNCCGSESSGWYIDDIQIIVKVPKFDGSFESGIGDWGSDRGQWQTGIGSSISGPEACATGTQCVGTNFDGNYGGRTDSRLISPTTRLPDAGKDEEIHLRFNQWFSLSDLDIGYIQISVLDETSGQWSDWVSIGNTIENTSTTWSPMSVDLTAYAGKKVRVGFYHTANRLNCCGSESSGWYIDDIQIIVKVPKFDGSFESGIGDWGSDRGQWQTGIGSSISGPETCATGTQCVGTNFDGNYGGRTDSRLISPTTRLPDAGKDEEIRLRFNQWFSLSDLDIGYIQVSVLGEKNGQWADWINVGNPIENTSTTWSPVSVDLTAYAGKKVRVGFYHTANRHNCCGSESSGWYADDIRMLIVDTLNDNTPVIKPDQLFFIDENSTPNSIVGTIIATDLDAGTIFSNFTISGDTFEVDFNTGQITVSNSAILDFETTSSYTPTVTVSDGGWQSTAVAITIDINDINEPPIIEPGQQFKVSENIEVGTVIGAVNASDPDNSTDSLMFTITSTTFAIHTESGKITVLNNKELDYEKNTSFTEIITVSDGVNNSTQEITIDVTDIDENTSQDNSSLATNSSNTSGGGSLNVMGLFIVVIILILRSLLENIYSQISFNKVCLHIKKGLLTKRSDLKA